MNKKNRNVYFVSIGTKDFYHSFFNSENPDKDILKFVNRWISLFWKKYAAKNPGSLKYDIDNNEVFVTITKNILNPAGVIPYEGWTRIHHRAME